MAWTLRPPHSVVLRVALLIVLVAASVHVASAGPTTPGGQPAQHDAPAVRQISGIYPHLTTYGIYSQNGAHRRKGHDECGIGAIVPWAGRLWMVNYAPHMPRGSEHKLFSITPDLRMTVHPESVGGTPAGRMIHRETQQLLIGPYLIDSDGHVRVIPPEKMPGRLTAIARHLVRPADWVYYFDMEGALYEANVRSLEVRRLFIDPIPGWHGKGGYTSQRRLVLANNGERRETEKNLKVGGPPTNDDEAGVLAEWDGKHWQIVERRQFTDVTGPGGIYGAPDDSTPLWAIGWDRRSLRLKVLDNGQWSTLLLPKAAHNNDPQHGWYTEWPRIRAVGNGQIMMDMHGMFFKFPKTLSQANTAGLAPMASHLRYIPDFCEWNGRLVLASDETSIQGNPLAGQPQSNLWLGTLGDLKKWGPATGYGGPWVGDRVAANQPTAPFLVNGFDHLALHLAVGAGRVAAAHNKPLRAADQQPIHALPDRLRNLVRIAIPRGDWHAPAPGFHFRIDQPATIYLAVDRRGNPRLAPLWHKTAMTLGWGDQHQDDVYSRQFPAGEVAIAGNPTEHEPNAFGMPHLAFVAGERVHPVAQAPAVVIEPPPATGAPTGAQQPRVVHFRIEIDRAGHGQWQRFTTLEVADGCYRCFLFPDDLDAKWVRLVADQDCLATAYFHLTDADYHDGTTSSAQHLFAGLADVTDARAYSARIYAAKRNRNLRLITANHRHFEFGKRDFTFHRQPVDAELEDLLDVQPALSVDDASVIVTMGRRRLRLPKGSPAFDRPVVGGWPRMVREVESERILSNFHGTFYEVPLRINGQPPAFDLMRPVASHTKQISDYCSWNGLLVLTGVRPDAATDGHTFVDTEQQTGIWLGGIDDLWQLGKPVGHGGPWYRSKVGAKLPSDPYLMTGYDRKSVTLRADRAVRIKIEIDFDHQTGWHTYRTVDIVPDKPWQYTFPHGFSAHWIRFTANTDCTATAQLVYE